MTAIGKDQTFRSFLHGKREDELLWALETGSPELQRKICFEIGRRRMGSAVSLLRRLLRSADDEKVRAAAADALGEVGDPIAGEDLIAVFRDSKQPFASVERCPCVCLKSSDSSYKLQPYLAHLLSGLADPNRTVRLCVLTALAAIRDARAYGYIHLASEAEQDPEVKKEMHALLDSYPKPEVGRMVLIDTNIFSSHHKYLLFVGTAPPGTFQMGPSAAVWVSTGETIQTGVGTGHWTRRVSSEAVGTGLVGPWTAPTTNLILPSAATTASKISLPKLPVSEEAPTPPFQKFAA